MASERSKRRDFLSLSFITKFFYYLQNDEPLFATLENTIIMFLYRQQFCITIVFSFSWDLESSQEKLKAMLTEFFLEDENIVEVFSKVENNWEGL